MSDASVKRQVTALIGRCYAGLDAADLRDEVLRSLRRIMSVDAAFFGTVDPQTLLFTSAAADEPMGASTSSPRRRSLPIQSARSTGPPAVTGPPVLA
jgi:hypothetical protein